MRGAARAAVALSICAAISGCGGGGGTDSGSGTGGPGGTRSGLHPDLLNVLAIEPADGAVQVAVDTAIHVTFDRVLTQECLLEPDTRLQARGETDPVPWNWSITNEGRGVVFTPTAPLAIETDYVLTLSAFTCDIDGRLLEEDLTFTFRTIDETPPTVLSSSVADGAIDVGRTAPFEIQFDEAIAAESVDDVTVYLRDAFGTAWPLDLRVESDRVHAHPAADLAGSRSFVLVARGVEDRAGNRMTTDWSIGFRTAADADPPAVTTLWPQSAATCSPRIRPTVSFDESIDPLSVERSNLTLSDPWGNLVDATVEASRDRRTLRLFPARALAAGQHEVQIRGGPGGITDA